MIQSWLQEFIYLNTVNINYVQIMQHLLSQVTSKATSLGNLTIKMSYNGVTKTEKP